MHATATASDCGGFVLQLAGSVSGRPTASSVYARGSPCDYTPTIQIETGYPAVQAQHIQQAITKDAGVNATLTSFNHTDGKTYVRSNDCLLYQYNKDTPLNPFDGMSLSILIVMASGHMQDSICAPPPPSPPAPPAPPPPSQPCTCNNTCGGLRDDGGNWTTNKGTARDVNDDRILQTAKGGWCNTRSGHSCAPKSVSGNDTVSFANNGYCEDGGVGGRKPSASYFMCEYKGGDFSTPYAVCQPKWFPCAHGERPTHLNSPLPHTLPQMQCSDSARCPF